MLHIVDWCAKECERQRSGERSVAHMYEAWLFARSFGGRGMISYDRVVSLGTIVEPEKNQHGIRITPVRFKTAEVIPADNIQSALTSLIEHGKDLTPAEWYLSFEEIHPFIDGNGRVGAIMYNWLAGSLDKPTVPPEFRRVQLHGS